MEVSEGDTVGDAVIVGTIVEVEVLAWDTEAALQDNTTMPLPRMKGISASLRLRFFSV